MIRFTETDKWKDPWFLKMKPTEKLVWFYIIENCDNAGFIEWDADICAMFTGMKPEHVGVAFQGLVESLLGAKSGAWIHVPNFLRHQKNEKLNHDNNAHKKIIRLIEEKRDLFPEVYKKHLGANTGATASPIGSSRGRGRGSSKVNTPPELKEVTAYAAEYAERNNLNAHQCIEKAKEAFKFYSDNMREMGASTWKDGQGNSVKNWKLKLANNWFKDMGKPKDIERKKPISI